MRPLPCTGKRGIHTPTRRPGFWKSPWRPRPAPQSGHSALLPLLSLPHPSAVAPWASPNRAGSSLVPSCGHLQRRLTTRLPRVSQGAGRGQPPARPLSPRGPRPSSREAGGRRHCTEAPGRGPAGLASRASDGVTSSMSPLTKVHSRGRNRNCWQLLGPEAPGQARPPRLRPHTPTGPQPGSLTNGLWHGGKP